MNNKTQQVEMAIADILNQSGLQVDVAYYLLLNMAKDLKIMWYEALYNNDVDTQNETTTQMDIPITIPEPQLTKEQKGE